MNSIAPLARSLARAASRLPGETVPQPRDEVCASLETVGKNKNLASASLFTPETRSHMKHL
jgi:hypothetical protein